MKRAALGTLILSLLIAAAACRGDGRSQSGGQDRPGPVGGCASDTIPLDLGITAAGGGGVSPDRVSILSVERAGDETYLEAAGALAAVLDSLGIEIVNTPVLTVVREGPCWPRCRIDFRVEKGASKRFPEVKAMLEGSEIGGMVPALERPDGYGVFFVQAASGSTDRWTLWYAR
jgi:hypothetical protein